MASTNDFLVQLLAKLDVSSVNKEFEELKKRLTNDPVIQKVTLDTSMSKQAIKSMASEIHNELGKAFKATGIESFDITVKDVESILSSAVKESNKLANELESASSKAQKFLAQFNNKSGGTLVNSKEFKAVQDAINGLGKTSSIDDLNKAMNTLETTYNNMVSSLRNSGKSLNPFINAKNEMATMDDTIKGIGLEFEKLTSKPKAVSDAIKQLSAQQSKVNSYTIGTQEWADAYGKLQQMIQKVNSEISNLRKAQSAKVSTQIFNTSDLKNNNIAYMSKVYNTIEKQMVEINRLAKAKDWQIVDVSGVEQADGKIKKLTLTVRDAEGALKKLDMQREKLQGNGKAQYGLMQVGDIKILETASQAMDQLAEKANKIQLSTDVTKLTTDYQKFGVVSQEVENNLKELRLAQEAVINAKGTDRLATEIEKYDSALAKAKSSWKELSATQVSLNQRTSQMTSMQEWMRKNGAATKLCGDQVRQLIEECKTCDAVRFNGIKREFDDLVVQAGKANKLGKGVIEGIVDQGKRFIQWVGVSGAIMRVGNSLRSATNNVIELDTKMVELSKVSDLTKQGLEDVTNQCYDLGESLSKTGTDVLDAVTTFKRAGYDIADSMKYAEEALKTANISENLKDASQNANSLVNIMKGFQNETPEFAKKINDAVNQVSNTEAVNFDNLIDGATRLSAVADQAGLSFEQMLGTLTGGYEILGNMEKVATGQITIFSRLQAIQLDGEEEVSTVAKLQEKFSNATKGAVNIVDKTSGQLRNVYDILDDLAGVWDTLDKNTREALAIEAAGKIYARICGNTYRESSYIG